MRIIVSFLILSGFLAYYFLFQEPDNPILTVLVSFLGFLINIFYPMIKNWASPKDKLESTDISKHDIQLYGQFSELFHSSYIRELMDCDFSHKFPSAILSPLEIYLDNWRTIEHKFLDPSLQSFHDVFQKDAENFAEEFGNRTVPINTVTASVTEYSSSGRDEINDIKMLSELRNRLIRSHQSLTKYAISIT